MHSGRKKILFVAEAVTLAHVARPLVLSSMLDPTRFDVNFACDVRSKWLLADFPGQFLPLPSLSSDKFLTALKRGTPLYSAEILDAYVRDDLKLIDEVRPDVVVGDFRLSLSISARLAGVPYLSICNCYWSPFWRPPRYTVPDLPFLTRYLPLRLADALFQLGRPIAFARHCGPLNRTRRRHGLPSLGNDLRRIYCDADQVLYADVPDLFPDVRLPAAHRFVGPLLWSPPVVPPAWWHVIGKERPVVYVTLGSSGHSSLLPLILRSLAALEITVIAATGGADMPKDVPANAFVAQYLPGEESARRARLVICNGGSLTCQQALAAGVPVIGIASNLDQFLNMDTLVRAGAGEIMRADRFDERRLVSLVTHMIAGSSHRAVARQMADAILRYDGRSQLSDTIGHVLKA